MHQTPRTIEEKVESWKNRDTKSRDDDYGQEFKRDFVLFVNYQKYNDDCFFIILKSMRKQKQRPMVSHSRHRTTNTIEKKNKDKKKLPWENGRGKTVDRIHQHTIIREVETDLEKELASIQRPMVSHSKHQTTDAIEQKNKDKKKFLGEHGIGKHGMRKSCAQQAFCINSWPSASPSATVARICSAPLALPMGPLVVHLASAYELINKCTEVLKVWRRRWNLGRIGTEKVGMMVEQILQRGDYGEEFKRDFVLYVYYEKKEKQRPMVSHSKHQITDVVEQKNKDQKKFLGEHVYPWGAWNGIDHQTIIREVGAYIQEELASMG
ncbi:hypothetical protein Cgig2_002772 [Carnegiea gigantea]|uniref:Uncharacterized protein n=1 Tax=Carnegiea gigantea TaxID=171969 RepID=A0A9Q1JLN5_9CARY|nr:hypothetical protein Cgig2_002772 [Carnegiea gigantea]